MLVIAMTGGIGAGKSTVTQLFQKYDVPVIDTDVIARELVDHNSEVKQNLKQLFGADLFDQADNLDRQALRHKVFADQTALIKLQDLLHPLIHQTVIKQLHTLQADYCLVIIPLLYESRFDYPHDRVLVIDLDTQTQLERAMQRDNANEQLIRQIMQQQASREQRLSIADDIIDNSAGPQQLSDQVAQLHQRYLTLAKQNDSANLSD